MPYPPRPDQGWTHPDTFPRDIPAESHQVRVMPCPEPGRRAAPHPVDGGDLV